MLTLLMLTLLIVCRYDPLTISQSDNLRGTLQFLTDAELVSLQRLRRTPCAQVNTSDPSRIESFHPRSASQDMALYNRGARVRPNFILPGRPIVCRYSCP